MKKYNQDNYNRYRKDLKKSQPNNKKYSEYTRDELIIKFMPLVENLARKFSTSQQATGIMSVNDLIQFGHFGLIKAIDKIIWKTIYEASDPEKRLKSFLSKRIKGAIRRSIDSTRGTMRIPEHKLNEMRKSNGNDKNLMSLYYNSVFTSLEEMLSDENNMVYEIPDKSDEVNNETLNSYLLDLLKNNLSEKENMILKLSYGLDCEKHSAKQIAEILNIKGDSAYVRVSQLKRQAINKLSRLVNRSQVVDYL